MSDGIRNFVLFTIHLVADEIIQLLTACFIIPSLVLLSMTTLLEYIRDVPLTLGSAMNITVFVVIE